MGVSFLFFTFGESAQQLVVASIYLQELRVYLQELRSGRLGAREYLVVAPRTRTEQIRVDAVDRRQQKERRQCDAAAPQQHLGLVAAQARQQLREAVTVDAPVEAQIHKQQERINAELPVGADEVQQPPEQKVVKIHEYKQPEEHQTKVDKERCDDVCEAVTRVDAAGGVRVLRDAYAVSDAQEDEHDVRDPVHGVLQRDVHRV